LKLILLLWLLFVRGGESGKGECIWAKRGRVCGLFLDKANVKAQATKKTGALCRQI